ncbi:Pam3-gp28 family putative phage holin [Allorhizobium borbori]|uniref:Uncharacterized protein n=1 Tax=Allorhizobium borbori TaxID=485907 RepID=A0A7W6P057_9HYPH|nr:hypothetical protein [Allorhizobium borbori]MBB4102412.1 hypothetical protein [Allorhizobium borbori]
MPKTALIILIRQALVVGGSLVVGSTLDPSQVETVAGAVATLIGVVWEVYENRHALRRKTTE